MNTSNSHNQSIILCPGQGAQHVGMAKAWCEKFPIAAKTFADADRVLGFSIKELCFNGPEEMLSRTDVAQPAIFVASVACYRALAESGDIAGVSAAAGLSLGEFTALHLAGAFDFETGLKLVHLRGRAMQQAAESTPGGMAALVGADESQAQKLCAAALQSLDASAVLVPANFNCPGQIVLSGSKDACEQAAQLADGLGIKATPLKVAGAFHCPLMKPAADRLAAALDQVRWARPAIPVMSNVTATPHEADQIDAIKQRLVQQLTNPVRWEQCMTWLAKNASGRWIELAPGKVLMGLMRRIDRNIKIENHAEPPATVPHPV